MDYMVGVFKEKEDKLLTDLFCQIMAIMNVFMQPLWLWRVHAQVLSSIFQNYYLQKKKHSDNTDGDFLDLTKI